MESRMAWRWLIPASMALLGACRSAPDPKGDSGTDTPASPCQPGTAPEITDFAVNQGDPVAKGPTLLVTLNATDLDGDLQEYSVELWFDQTIDDKVAQAPEQHIEASPVHLNVIACGAPSISYEMQITLLGNQVLAFDTLYEFAAVLTDAAGLASTPVLTTAQTPKALDER